MYTVCVCGTVERQKADAVMIYYYFFVLFFHRLSMRSRLYSVHPLLSVMVNIQFHNFTDEQLYYTIPYCIFISVSKKALFSSMLQFLTFSVWLRILRSVSHFIRVVCILTRLYSIPMSCSRNKIGISMFNTSGLHRSMLRRRCHLILHVFV